MISQSCVRRSSHIDGPTGIEAVPAGGHASPFCIAIGTICIPGRLLFSANFSFAIDYQVEIFAYHTYVCQSLVLFDVLLYIACDFRSV